MGGGKPHLESPRVSSLNLDLNAHLTYFKNEEWLLEEDYKVKEWVCLLSIIQSSIYCLVIKECPSYRPVFFKLSHFKVYVNSGSWGSPHISTWLRLRKSTTGAPHIPLGNRNFKNSTWLVQIFHALNRSTPSHPSDKWHQWIDLIR